MTADAARCPVCDGRGTVPAGFYSPTAPAGGETCRSCGGRGYVVVEAAERSGDGELDLTYRPE